MVASFRATIFVLNRPPDTVGEGLFQPLELMHGIHWPEISCIFVTKNEIL